MISRVGGASLGITRTTIRIGVWMMPFGMLCVANGQLETARIARQPVKRGAVLRAGVASSHSNPIESIVDVPVFFECGHAFLECVVQGPDLIDMRAGFEFVES